MGMIFAQPIEQYPQHLRPGTLPTVTGADSFFPASNLLTYDPTQVTKVNAQTTTITWDLGMARRMDIIALLFTNTSPRAVWRIAMSNDGTNWSAFPGQTSGDTAFWAQLTTAAGAGPFAEDADPRKGALLRNHGVWLLQDGTSCRYIRIIVTDVGSSSLTFGRLFVGRAFRPAMNWQYGSSFSFDDTGRRERTDRGALVLDPGRVIVSASVKLDFLSTNELYDFVYEFNAWRGACREILAVLDTDVVSRLHKNMLYATITDGRRVVAEEFNAWSQTWILESIA